MEGIGKGAFIYFFPRNFVFKFLVEKGERALPLLLFFCKFSGRGREGGGPWALPAKFFGLGISAKKNKIQSEFKVQNKCLRLRSEREKRGNINSTRRGGKAKEFPLSIVRKCDNNASRCSSRSFPPFVGLEKGGRKLLLPLYFFFLPFFPLYSENNSFSPSFNCPAITQKLLGRKGDFYCTIHVPKAAQQKKGPGSKRRKTLSFSLFCRRTDTGIYGKNTFGLCSVGRYWQFIPFLEALRRGRKRKICNGAPASNARKSSFGKERAKGKNGGGAERKGNWEK